MDFCKINFRKAVSNMYDYSYDVVLSFAGEDRVYVREIAKKLKQKKLRVFYDEFEEKNLWGKDLYQYLHYIYKESALYCVIFVSSDYIKKAWTIHELKAAQNRAFLDSREYILPLLLEKNVKLPGLPDTTGYISSEGHTATQIAGLIFEKVKDVKPTKQEELLAKANIYHVVFETFDFIVTRFVCFGRGSKVIELSLLEYLINEYKDFLLEHAHEINSDLYVFLVQLLKDVGNYIEERTINIFNSTNLQYRANVLIHLKRALEESGFSSNFDFWYYIHNSETLTDRDQLLKTALDDIATKIKERTESEVTFGDYIKQLARLAYFDQEDVPIELTEEIICNSDELKELEEQFESSRLVSFSDDESD